MSPNTQRLRAVGWVMLGLLLYHGDQLHLATRPARAETPTHAQVTIDLAYKTAHGLKATDSPLATSSPLQAKLYTSALKLEMTLFEQLNMFEATFWPLLFMENTHAL